MFYEYECRYHGVFEAQHSINDPPLSCCPTCISSGCMEYCCLKCNKTWQCSDPARTEPGTNKQNHPTTCQYCGEDQISYSRPQPKRLISLSSFALKGGGWAKEGYK